MRSEGSNAYNADLLLTANCQSPLPASNIMDLMPKSKRKAFTVTEANAMVPELLSTLETITSHIETGRAQAQKIQILDTLWGDAVRSLENPDHDEFRHHTQALKKLNQELNKLVQCEIFGKGLRLPNGGLENGLVDFPTIFEGRWIYLCWHRGESQVTFWHEIRDGFSGRQEITTEHIIRMGREDDPDEVDDSNLDF